MLKNSGNKNKTPIKKTEQTSTVIDTLEPYHEPIKPEQLLSDIESFIKRFIVCNEETTIATTLWITMTWFIDTIDIAPLAVITAPEKRCGKSQLLFLMNRLVKNPLSASNITPAALFRSIAKWSPTILIDEADAFLKDNEELRGILNCGHSRDSAFIIRSVGKEHEPTMFNVWGAKALAGIGHLSETIMDRAIVLELRRKLSSEKVERLRDIDKGYFNTIKAKLARFAIDFSDRLCQLKVALPEALNDREQDNWEPLLKIAILAGDEWFERAVAAAIKLSSIDKSNTSIGIELLSDIKDIFDNKNIDRIRTVDLLNDLCFDPEQPWFTYNRGQPITPKQIAKILKGFGIKSKGIRFGLDTPKGYEKSHFDEAFSRYLEITYADDDMKPHATT